MRIPLGACSSSSAAGTSSSEIVPSRSGRGRACRRAQPARETGSPLRDRVAAVGDRDRDLRVEEVELEVDVERAPGRRHADERRCPGVAAHPHRVDEPAGRRDRGERVVDAARELAHLCNRFPGRAVDGVRRAELGGELELLATTSTATMRAAPASRAPWTTARPTPPHPITATDAPSWTGVAQSAAPAPVEKPHASRHACSAGSSSGIFTAHASCTITRSAKSRSAAPA